MRRWVALLLLWTPLCNGLFGSIHAGKGAVTSRLQAKFRKRLTVKDSIVDSIDFYSWGRTAYRLNAPTRETYLLWQVPQTVLWRTPSTM